MEFLRTPDDRFANLPDFPYEPHYIDVLDGDARMHYIDEGEGEVTLLCLHGEPSWSFLYRHIIAELKDEYRIIAPDLLGFGRSDKPTDDDDHTYFLHHRTLFELLHGLDLQHVTLVCQDWGGILGLPLAVKNSDRFERLVIMNTGLPTGDISMGEGFDEWRAFAEKMGRQLKPGLLVKQSTVRELPDDVVAAYDAPFPDESYRAGVAALPLRVPRTTDDPGAPDVRQTRERLKEWRKPALVMFSDQDPVTKGGDAFFRKLIPSASQQPTITIESAGHFLQEDQGTVIAGHIRDFIQRTPDPTAGIEVVIEDTATETVTKNLDKKVVDDHEAAQVSDDVEEPVTTSDEDVPDVPAEDAVTTAEAAKTIETSAVDADEQTTTANGTADSTAKATESTATDTDADAIDTSAPSDEGVSSTAATDSDATDTSADDVNEDDGEEEVDLDETILFAPDELEREISEDEKTKPGDTTS